MTDLAEARRRYQNYESALGRVQELETAIKEHAAQRGNDRCFLDDLHLYSLVAINEHPGLSLPKEEFLSNCSKYYDCQQTGRQFDSPEKWRLSESEAVLINSLLNSLEHSDRPVIAAVLSGLNNDERQALAKLKARLAELLKR